MSSGPQHRMTATTMPSRRPAVLAAALAIAIAIGSTPPAWADPATSEEVRALAEQAQTDPAALAQLRTIDEVDGRPVDLDAALGETSGDELQRRLDELAAAPATGSTPADPAADRDSARDILDGRKYNPVDPPRPFRGILKQIGEWLDTIFGPVVRPIGDWLGSVSGNRLVQWIVPLAVIGAAFVIGIRLSQRRAASELLRRTPRGADERGDDPETLERLADGAERAGDLSRAYRLRFRAGLLRLDAKGAIKYRPSMTTSALARAVLSPSFAHLAGEFDEVAYGNRPVAPDDLQASRHEWRRVLEEAVSR